VPGPLRVDRPADGVVLLTLALPDRRNAMTEALTQAWGETIAELSTDRSVRAVVVTGEGRAFCAGGDLSWLGAGDGESGDGESGPAGVPAPSRLRDRMLPFYRTWLSIRGLEVPTIAALNGAAIGAGLCLALACDLRYAVPEAKLAMPFTALGMHPGMAATYLLPEAVGLPRAREMLFTGRVVSGADAVDIGLVNAVVEPERLLDGALEIAGRAAAAAPIATRLTKRALQHGPRSFAEALEWEALAQPVTLATEDLREGLQAQAERRQPVFRGV
jgi:enoyl-CoA hydratase/carnithine racemase